MYPAKGMEQDVKLAGVVTEDDQIRMDDPMFQDGPQQGAFSGNPDMTIVGEVQRVKERFPFVFKDNVSERGQSFKLRLGKLSLIHVIKGFAV